MNRPDVTACGGADDRPTSGRVADGPWLSLRHLAPLILLAALCLTWLVACEPAVGENGDGETTSTLENGGTESGDVEGAVGEEIKAGRAIITVRALQATFQPAMPDQRMSEQTPPPPGPGESFYQAYVRVKNTGVTPLRVDGGDFFCAVGDSVVGIERTRSGPLPRSLLKNTSLDLLLTFKAQAGFEPILIYRPPWHDGVITISPESEQTTTTTT